MTQDRSIDETFQLGAHRCGKFELRRAKDTGPEATDLPPDGFIIRSVETQTPLLDDDGQILVVKTRREAEAMLQTLSVNSNIQDIDEKAGKFSRKIRESTVLLGSGAIFAACLVTAVFTENFEEIILVEGTVENALSSLGVIAFLALFVERAQYIYIRLFLGRKRVEFEHDLDKLALYEQHIRESGGARDESAIFRVRLARMTVTESIRCHDINATRHIAIFGMLLAILVSAVGPRVMEGTFQFVGESSFHEILFDGIDIFLTAGLISGSALGINKAYSALAKLLTGKSLSKSSD